MHRPPESGLMLTYTGGSLCTDNTRRSTEFYLECSHSAGIGSPTAVFGDCKYIVTWETSLACPVRQSPVLSLIFWALVALIAYLALGFLYNVRVKQLPLMDWRTLPHAETLHRVGQGLQTLVAPLSESIPDVFVRLRLLAAKAWSVARGRSPAQSDYSSF